MARQLATFYPDGLDAAYPRYWRRRGGCRFPGSWNRCINEVRWWTPMGDRRPPSTGLYYQPSTIWRRRTDRTLYASCLMDEGAQRLICFEIKDAE